MEKQRKTGILSLSDSLKRQLFGRSRRIALEKSRCLPGHRSPVDSSSRSSLLGFFGENRQDSPVFRLLVRRILTVFIINITVASAFLSASAQEQAPSGVKTQLQLNNPAVVNRVNDVASQNTTSYVQNTEKTFLPQKMKAEQLATRFIPLLPGELRQQTSWRVDPARNSFTLTGPIQAIAIAEQLIPKMDANLQLTNGYVDVGLAVPNEKVQRPAIQKDQNTNTLPKVDRYYDPNQNRYVNVAWQSDAAILPTSDPQSELTVFGKTKTENTPNRSATDLVAYQCPPNAVVQVETRLKQQFGNNPQITVASNIPAGKIFILASQKDQQQAGAFLGTMKIYPVSEPLQQNDSRIADGTVYPVTGRSVTVPTGNPGVHGQLVYTPSQKRVQELEKIAVALFGDKLQMLPKNSNPNQTPGEAARNTWQFKKRSTPGDATARYCQIDFDPLNQKIYIRGDNALCTQMFQLFEAVEARPQNAGNVRRFISIRQVDTKKIKEILDIYNQRRNGRSPLSRSGVRSEKNSVGFADYISSGISDSLTEKNSFATNESTKIKQVNYQEVGNLGEGLGDAGLTGGGSAIDALGTNNSSGMSGSGHGVGIVQDYIPQVLPDLDVVIIDAPESEYRRIENMIREIEELAKLAEPSVEIYNLKHVNCVMLQGILQELHQEMFVTKQGRVIIFAMQNPNAILLVGWGHAFTAMKDLINTFDQPILEANNMIRVIRLQYASATEIAAQLTTYFPQPQPISGGMSPRIRVFPDIRTNSIVVQAAPNDMLEIQKLLTDLDVNKAAPKLLVKTFKMKNLLAQDMRTILRDAIMPSVQGTSDGASAKYPILQILSVDADSKKLIESGIMTDVSITADVYSNQLVVTAPEDCMELIGKLIQTLDVAPAKAQIKIFRIINGDATQIEKTIRSLLPTGTGTLPTLPNAEGEETFVPVKLSVDTRTNCIIAAAAPKDLKIIEALIVSLDRKDIMERKEVIVPLRNVQALSIAQAIDDYLSRKQKLEISSEAMSVYQMFESQVIVIPESITNSLIISATPRYLEEIKTLVKEFDRDPPQVVIQVLIAEVTLNNYEEFGIEAGLQDKVAFDRSVITSTSGGVNSATGVPGYDIIGNNSIGENMLASNQKTVAGQVLNTLGMGRANSTLGYSGLVLAASSRSVEVTLRALLEKSRLQVLSRPQITAMDNQQAFILVGQRVPRVDKANMTDYGISSSVTDANVGLILLVTPRVGEDGRVIMEIGVEKSSLAGDSDAVPIFVADNQVIKSQSINTTQAMTAISAQDGETVMLGGLISTSKQKVRHGIPYVSDLPWVGWLFRYDQFTENRKELLIVMTPRIVRDKEDIEEIKRVEASRMNWCLADAMAINGNMGLFDPLSGECPDLGNCPPKTIPFHHNNDPMKDLENVKPYSPDRDYNNGNKDEQNYNNTPRRYNGNEYIRQESVPSQIIETPNNDLPGEKKMNYLPSVPVDKNRTKLQFEPQMKNTTSKRSNSKLTESYQSTSYRPIANQTSIKPETFPSALPIPTYPNSRSANQQTIDQSSGNRFSNYPKSANESRYDQRQNQQQQQDERRSNRTSENRYYAPNNANSAQNRSYPPDNNEYGSENRTNQYSAEPDRDDVTLLGNLENVRREEWQSVPSNAKLY